MLKQLNRLVLTIVAVCFLTFPSVATAQNDYNQSVGVIHSDIKVNDLDLEPINTQEVKKTVVPDTQKEGKKVFALFLRTMSGVLFSIIVLYLVLVFIKKYHGSAFVNPDDEEYFEAFDLSTPDNRQDALKSFLNRTK